MSTQKLTVGSYPLELQTVTATTKAAATVRPVSVTRL